MKTNTFQLILTALICSVQLFGAIEIDGIYYNLSGTEATVTYNSKYSGDIIIPDSITYSGTTYNVTSIGVGAFISSDKRISVTIPSSVTQIILTAFLGSDSLASISVAAENPNFSDLDGVLFNKDKTTLLVYPNAKGAVYTVPDGVTTIGKTAFFICNNLTSVTISNSVTEIEESAFSFNGRLKEINIGNSVAKIANGAFSECRGLKNISVAADNSNYSDLDGILFNKDKTTLLVYPNAKSAIYTIPGSVTEIGAQAFSSHSLISITIPESVAKIGRSAFSFCPYLEEIYVENPTPPVCENGVFTGVRSMDCILHVPVGSYSAYAEAEGWSAFTNVWNIDIDNVPAGTFTVYIQNGIAVIDGVATGETAAVYTSSGILLQTEKASAGRMEIPLPAQGIYIVKAGNETVKVMW